MYGDLIPKLNSSKIAGLIHQLIHNRPSTATTTTTAVGIGGNNNNNNNTSNNNKIWLLCLTTGNYNGLGITRVTELNQASKALGCHKCIVLDDQNNFPDHPTKRWNKDYVSKYLNETIKEHIAQEEEESATAGVGSDDDDGIATTRRRVVLITFDDLGVSGHVNHRDTYLAVFDRIIKQSILGPSTIKVVKKKEMDNKEIELYMEGYQLQSERNMIKKYVPMIRMVVAPIMIALGINGTRFARGNPLRLV